MDANGLILCAKYSSAPNYFGYCGPPKNSSLIDHLRDNIGDKEVENILSQFDSLYLNLKLIAHENKIDDPFAKKVVEAYWIGNSLLNNVKNKDYVSLLSEKFELHKKIGLIKFAKLRHKFLSGKILPHHSFHVFNIFKRTGHVNSNHTLATMDNCRVGFGQIINFAENQNSKIKTPNLNLKTKNIFARAKLLQFVQQKLKLTKPELVKLKIDYKGKTFIKSLKIGDWVSFHWGFVCDVLATKQVRNLEFYTQQAINYFNS